MTSTDRDLRIDFFRGLALLIVVVDHLEGWAGQSLTRSWTLRAWGYSDAAEVFVFLSGYVFASAYRGTLARHGLTGGLRKALGRAGQIYLAYLAAALTVINVGVMLIEWGPPGGPGYRIGEQAWQSIGAALTLRFQPWGFPILSFYVLILPVMAALLHLVFAGRAWLAWLISASVYLLVQVYPHWNLPRFGDGRPWAFNPLAWQFLFFIGLYLGSRAPRLGRCLPRPVWMALSGAVLVQGAYATTGMPDLSAWNSSLGSWLDASAEFGRTWAGKQVLQPMRVIHFLALAYLVSQLSPKNWAFWSGRLARPVVVCGQHSLEVYAFGLVLAFLGAFALSTMTVSTPKVLTLDLSVCLLSVGFAYMLRWAETPGSSSATTPDAAI